MVSLLKQKNSEKEMKLGKANCIPAFPTSFLTRNRILRKPPNVSHKRKKETSP